MTEATKTWSDMSTAEKKAANYDKWADDERAAAFKADAALKKERDGVSAALKKAGLKEDASERERQDAVEWGAEAAAKRGKK